MPFQIIRNDITKVKADAIVNTANPRPVIGGGTDRAVYQAAGATRILTERKTIGEMKRGQSAATSAGRLKAKYIIHTIGPLWKGGKSGEKETLAECYRNCLMLADSLHCRSIAFPMIATGVYGFPKDEALEIAVSEISSFLISHEMKVLLVVFDRKAFELSGRLFAGIDEYIDENYVAAQSDAEYGGAFPKDELSARHRREERYPEILKASGRFASAAANEALPQGNLDDVLKNRDKTFQERLFELIDERGMNDVAVYKKANIDRKLFSAIRKNTEYRPKKRTVLALIIALKLDAAEADDLLGRAEYAFSPSSRTDLIVSYFIRQKDYDILKINEALFKYHEECLGSGMQS